MNVCHSCDKALYYAVQYMKQLCILLSAFHMLALQACCPAMCLLLVTCSSQAAVVKSMYSYAYAAIFAPCMRCAAQVATQDAMLHCI